MTIHHDMNIIILKINSFEYCVANTNTDIVFHSSIPLFIQNKHIIFLFHLDLYPFLLHSSGRWPSNTSGKRTLRRNGPDNLTDQRVPANARSLKHQNLPGTLQELVILKMEPQRRKQWSSEHVDRPWRHPTENAQEDPALCAYGSPELRQRRGCPVSGAERRWRRHEPVSERAEWQPCS